MGSWFSRKRGGDGGGGGGRSHHSPTDCDYAAYAVDLAEVKTFLTELNMVMSQTTDIKSSDEYFACQFADNEGYLETLKIKHKQLVGIRKLVDKAKRGAHPPPESLVGTLDDAEVQCRQAITRLTQLRQQMQRKQQSSNEPLQQQQQPTDDVIDESAVVLSAPSDNNVDSNRSPSPMLSGVNSDLPSSRPAQVDDIPTSSETVQEMKSTSWWVEERTHSQQSPEACTVWEFDRNDDQYMLSVNDRYKKAKPRELDRKLTVKFTGEHGIDRGALTREFFYLTFEAFISGMFKECQMFIGERGHLLPNQSTEHLVEAYRTVGMMIAHAARNNCRGFPGLSPAIVHYLVHGKGRGSAFIEELCVPVFVDDVADTLLRTLLIKIDGSEPLTEEDKSVLETWLDQSNGRFILQPSTRQLIIQHLMIYYVFTKRIRQIEAIAEGMKILDFNKFLSDHPSSENISFVFPSADDTRVTPQLFLAAVVTRGDNFDTKAWEFFKSFLNDLDREGKESSSIAKLIFFLSGSPYLPRNVVISFSANNDVMPIAHACYNELQLPTGNNTYDQFCDNMLLGMEHREHTLS